MIAANRSLTKPATHSVIPSQFDGIREHTLSDPRT